MRTCNNCLHHDFCNVDGYIDADECGFFKNKADYAEVKHGYWIDKDDKYGRVFCSVCGAQERPWDSQYKSPRCPMCGAKMDRVRKGAK